MTTRTEYYTATGRHFVEKAGACLSDGDLLQASEKGWGAAAQAVKAVAEARGWSHNGHRQLYTTIDRLANETDDRRLRILFRSADSLHQNFYEGWMSRDSVEDGLRDVEELVDKLHALHI